MDTQHAQNVRREPVPWRRLRVVQFRLRTLLVFILLISLGLGYYMAQVVRQRQAVQTLRRMGGKIQYDSDYDPFVPSWLRDAVGPDFFAPVVGVEIVRGEFHGDDVAVLTQLPHLREIRFDCTFLTDKDLVHLRKLRKLESVKLQANQLTDKCMEHITELTELKTLFLCRRSDSGSFGGSISDEALRELQPLQRLEHLDLDGMYNITDAGLPHLARLKNLRHLSLSNTCITGKGLRHLAPLQQLRYVEVPSYGISSEEVMWASKNYLPRCYFEDVWCGCGCGSIGPQSE